MGSFDSWLANRCALAASCGPRGGWLWFSSFLVFADPGSTLLPYGKARIPRYWSQTGWSFTSSNNRSSWVGEKAPRGVGCLLWIRLTLVPLLFLFLPLQNVRVLPRTVLYVADSDTFIGQEECRGHKRGKYRKN